jgi:hypothetical protein
MNVVIPDINWIGIGPELILSLTAATGFLPSIFILRYQESFASFFTTAFPKTM